MLSVRDDAKGLREECLKMINLDAGTGEGILNVVAETSHFGTTPSNDHDGEKGPIETLGHEPSRGGIFVVDDGVPTIDLRSRVL